MATSNYEGFVFRLSGVTTSSGGTIPTGTGLEKVILTTRDLISRATAAAQLNDAQGLISGESTTFQVNPRPMAAAMTCPRRRRHLRHWSSSKAHRAPTR